MPISWCSAKICRDCKLSQQSRPHYRQMMSKTIRLKAQPSIVRGHTEGRTAEKEKLLVFTQQNEISNLCRTLLNLNKFAFVD